MRITYDDRAKSRMRGQLRQSLKLLRHTTPFELPVPEYTTYLSFIERVFVSTTTPREAEAYLEFAELFDGKIPMGISYHPRMYADLGSFVHTAVTFEATMSARTPQSWSMSTTYPHLHDMVVWIKQAAKTELRIRQAMDTGLKIIEACNTPGQIKRVLPNMVYGLKSQDQQQIAEAKIKSPWPRNLDRQEIEPRLGALDEALAASALLSGNGEYKLPWVRIPDLEDLDDLKIKMIVES